MWHGVSGTERQEISIGAFHWAPCMTEHGASHASSAVVRLGHPLRLVHALDVLRGMLRAQECLRDMLLKLEEREFQGQGVWGTTMTPALHMHECIGKVKASIQQQVGRHGQWPPCSPPALSMACVPERSCLLAFLSLASPVIA